MGHTFWKENAEDLVKLSESNILNCCLKSTMADLRKIGLKMGDDVSENLAPKFPSEGGAMSLTTLHLPLPPSPHESVHIFCLTGNEWSLTC